MCTSLWVNLGMIVAVAIASIIIGYAAYTVAHEALPILITTRGLSVSGQIVDLAMAFYLGNTGQVLASLLSIFGSILYVALAVGGFWFAIGFMSQMVTIWTLVLQLIFAAVFIGYAVYQLFATNCISI